MARAFTCRLVIPALTLVQVLPASRDRKTPPPRVPANRRAGSTGSTATAETYGPTRPVRTHEAPPSRDLETPLPPAYTVWGSEGATARAFTPWLATGNQVRPPSVDL